MSMTLREYVLAEGRGVISRMVRESGVANSTIHACLRGERVAKLETATRISRATKGKVPAMTLLEPWRGSKIKKGGAK